MTTGRFADPGLRLGGYSKQAVSLTRDLSRVENIIDTNALATSRLSTTQSALSQLSKTGQELLQSLSANRSGNIDPSILQVAASNALGAMTTLLNTALDGEYIFGGTNTGEKPFTDYAAPGSPAKAAFDTAFSAYFGFTQNDPQAETISAAEMNGFLDTVEAQLAGPDWNSNWSQSTDGGMESRIGLNETAQTSVGINDQSIRNFAMAASVIADLFNGNVGGVARTVVIDRATQLIGQATGGLATIQARLGLTENRVAAATDRLEAQADLFETHIQSLEGVDPYEASTRVSALTEQIETSYALTARIQRLSLAQYLG
jgi:flagellar hook-associated protein 3 FlgL